MLPAPIRIPSLRVRTKELARIVEEYAADAIAELSARELDGRKASFTDADRQWVIATRDRAPIRPGPGRRSRVQGRGRYR